MNQETSEHLLGAKPYSRCTVQTLFLTEYNDLHFTDEETKAMKLKNLSKSTKGELKSETMSTLLQNHLFFHHAVRLHVLMLKVKKSHTQS